MNQPQQRGGCRAARSAGPVEVRAQTAYGVNGSFIFELSPALFRQALMRMFTILPAFSADAFSSSFRAALVDAILIYITMVYALLLPLRYLLRASARRYAMMLPMLPLLRHAAAIRFICRFSFSSSSCLFIYIC